MTDEERERRRRTDEFINKYLVVGNPKKGMTCYGMMADARGTRQKDVARRIRRMSYDEFLKTIYWHLIAFQVKVDNNWKCSITGKRGNLEVHHDTYYEVHGFEMFHIKELICVCHEEHVKIHERMNAEQAEYYSRYHDEITS